MLSNVRGRGSPPRGRSAGQPSFRRPLWLPRLVGAGELYVMVDDAVTSLLTVQGNASGRRSRAWYFEVPVEIHFAEYVHVIVSELRPISKPQRSRWLRLFRSHFERRFE
jgi:hypothetical protein